MENLKDDLVGPGVEVEETHISWVFLADQEVWKVKKPVDLGFLDFTTLDRRFAACESEVRLNRRLAPHVYKGVVPITRGPDGRYVLGGSGPPVDWAVHMARLPRGHRADTLLANNELRVRDIDRLAVQLASFHAECRSDDETSRYGDLDVILRNVEENFDQTRDSITTYLTEAQADEIECWQRDFVQREHRRFHARMEDHSVRDGHGDLRLEHVYLDERGVVTIIDCIEFNERFRYGDVCSDLAFLSMDLTWQGRPDLAERLLAVYARESNDYDLFPLVNFYESYRAFVRGKVSSFLASSSEVDLTHRRRAAAEARRYFLLALASERRSVITPAVVVVGGIIGAGKSTVADGLGVEMATPVVDSDRARKFLLGVAPLERIPDAAWSGGYESSVTDRVYEELFRRADQVLASGRSVILDASFRTRKVREQARELAARYHVPFKFVECRVSRDVNLERLRQRERTTTVSDGRLELFDEFVAEWEVTDEISSDEPVRVDTALPFEQNVERLREELGVWPTGMTA